MFGDNDPEDAYDVGDPVELRAAVLGRVIASIVAERLAHGETPRVVARLAAARRMIDRLDDDLDGP